MAVTGDRVHGDPICRAPFSSLHLDPSGHVRVCELNSLGMLGRIGEHRLPDLWHGGRAARLRAAMRQHDLGLGCEDCAGPLGRGERGLAHASYYDEFPVPADDRPDWPRQLELSLSNTCNLQCIMCNGDLSSAIRARREHLPPLPKVYDDQFFDDLVPFLPHLQRVTFIGGEPFLGSESLRVFDLLGALDRPVPDVWVTTNGTVFNARVERILRSMPIDVSVSVDGATADTYESIREGASWAEVQDHLESFRRLARRVSLNLCLMVPNWHEFRRYLRDADERELDVHVNTVIGPRDLSLYHLPADDLAAVLSELRAQDEADPGGLGRNRRAWDEQMARLGGHLASLRTESPVELRRSAPSAAASAVQLVTDWADERGVHVMQVGESDLVVTYRPDPADVLGMDLRPLVGGHLTAMVKQLTGAFGDLAETRLQYLDGGVEHRVMAFFSDAAPTEIHAVLGDGIPGSDPPVLSQWHLGARTTRVDGAGPPG